MSITVELCGSFTPNPGYSQMPTFIGVHGGGSIQVSAVNATLLVIQVVSYGGSVSSITGAGLTWTRYLALSGVGASAALNVEVWTAPVVGAPINNETVTIAGSFGDSAEAMVFGLTGASGLFDTGNGTLPATAYGDGASITYELASSYSALIALQSQINYTPALGDPAGFANIITSGGYQGSTEVLLGSWIATPGTTAEQTTTNAISASVPGAIFAMFGVAGMGTLVPNVIGMLDGPAQTTITNAGLVVGTVTQQPSDQPLTAVLSQSPAAGTFSGYGASVDIVESEGIIVPDLTNLSLSVAVPAALAPVGLIVGAVAYQPSGTVLAGNVISQSPAPGTFASYGSAVNVLVSSGLPALIVPNIFGLTQTAATSLLLSLGLGVGAIGSAPSQFVPAGEVLAQNPSPGPAVAVGTPVSFVISTGAPVPSTAFDFEATVISQYANSPTILQLAQNLNSYIDQTTNFAEFFAYVWNVDTAVGFGLDIWGKIVNVSRLLLIPNTTDYVGFFQTGETTQDWQPMGSDQPPQPAVGGAMYTGYDATEAYLLPDDAYRQLILAKAFANICTTTAPALNQILQNLYGQGSAWVLNTGTMSISYNLNFTPTAIQLAILQQSGVIPTPPGVAVTINTDV